MKAGLSTSASGKFTCDDDLCGERYWERVIVRYFACIKCGNIVPGWLWIVLSLPRTWLIVWFPEVVNRQNSGMPWLSCYKNIVYKHENALRVFTWSNFVVDNQFWAEGRWIQVCFKGFVRLGNLDFDFKIKIQDLQSNARYWDTCSWIPFLSAFLGNPKKGEKQLNPDMTPRASNSSSRSRRFPRLDLLQTQI